MTVDLRQPRPDIIYLRRRLKPGEVSKSASEASSSFLDLSRTNSSEPSQIAPQSLSSTPYVIGDTVLTESVHTVRLNKRQSAIGSLVIDGADHVGWQMINGETGYLYEPGSLAKNANMIDPVSQISRGSIPEVIPPATKNRPALEFYKGKLVVGLRQLHRIKRFIIAPKPGAIIHVTNSFGTLSITLPYSSDGAMYVSTINNELDFKFETYRNNLHDTFSIGTFTPPANRVADFINR